MHNLNKIRTIDVVGIKLDNFFQLPFHVYLKDRFGKYLECNQAQAVSFGIENINEIIGKTDKDFHSRQEAKVLRINDIKTQKTETPVVVIEQCTFINKGTMPMLSYKIPVVGNNKKVIGVFGTSIPFNQNQHMLAPIIPINDKLMLNANIAVQERHNNNIAKSKKISTRERECLEHLIQGMTAKQIARRLNLSPRTIEFYIENLKKKFGCYNRAELIAKVYDLYK